MTREQEIEREDFHELGKALSAGLSEYSADPAAQRRLGKFIADAALRIHQVNATHFEK